MKLTIILTVYNKEQYLQRALDSLLNQMDVDNDDYEVLAINDGSSDGSLSILNDYALHYSRLRILNQENQGLSMARNNGIDEAKGRYVWFVDADDEIALNSVNIICNTALFNYDIIPIYAKTEGVDRVRNRVNVNVLTGKDIIVGGHWEQCGVFWVYKRVFLIDNNLYFMPGVYHEDSEFTPRMLYFAKTVKVVPEVLYTVHRDPNSITQIPRSKRAFDYLVVTESLCRFIKEYGEDKTEIGKTIYTYIAEIINMALYIIVKNNPYEQKKFNQQLYNKRLLVFEVLRNAKKVKYRIESILFRLFPRHCVRVYKMMKMI